MCECMGATGARVYGCTSARVQRVHGCTGVQVHGCTGARVHGEWVHRCTGARVHGCKGARVHGCTGVTGARVHGEWVHGCCMGVVTDPIMTLPSHLKEDTASDNRPNDEVRLHERHDHDRVEEDEGVVETGEPGNHEDDESQEFAYPEAHPLPRVEDRLSRESDPAGEVWGRQTSDDG